ncbi:E3 ubiquitin-protein ligase TRIM35-like [Sardina pilchardus]|uniref:E3 ubiquitin-protein ligase TRIM35-like n=1 Tax=Sardina pilchardus TaxID=27697 RepID=UPI002E10212A
MASKRSLTEVDFSCPVCCDVFKDPVIMTCSHSVCKVCLQKFWEAKGSRECPICRKRFTETQPPPNLALRNLCETYLQEKSQRASAGSEVLCSLHSEKLKLFCLEDKQPVCLVCRDSLEHINHNFRPVVEISRQFKEELRIQLGKIKENKKTHDKIQQKCNKAAQHIKKQAQHTEKQIREEFEKLHQFLRDEEAARIAALREEVEQKTQMVDISALSDTIKALEQELRADDITFLQVGAIHGPSSISRAQCTLQDPERVSGALINVAKHLGNLKFRVWEKMQEIVQYTPVTLDPNTANPLLILSEDLTSVRSGISLLPDNPERCNRFYTVLGSEGFNSGTHCWDVEVGERMLWEVGVMTESRQRKGKHIDDDSGLWYVLHINGTVNAVCSLDGVTRLTMQQKLQRIRVQLDWDRGELSFSDPDNNTHLHTLKHTFTEKVFPYFRNSNDNFPLRILPVKASVMVDVTVTVVP